MKYLEILFCKHLILFKIHNFCYESQLESLQFLELNLHNN